MQLFKSFINGFFSLLFGLCELLTLSFRILYGTFNQYPKAISIWKDRTNSELFFYFLGLSLSLIWPLIFIWFSDFIQPFMPLVSEIGDNRTWHYVLFFLHFLFFALIFITLFGPIGARLRYKWLCRGGKNLNERLFVGLLPINMILRVPNKISFHILHEILGMLILILLGPTILYFSIYAFDDKAFVASQHDRVLEFSDFLYLSCVTLFTIGYGDIYPRNRLAQFVCCVQIATGWMYMVGLLSPLMSSIAGRYMSARPFWKYESDKSAGVRNILEIGLSRLFERERNIDGILDQPISADCITSVFAFKALENCKNWWSFPPTKNICKLGKWCRSEIRHQEEPIKLIANLCLSGKELSNMKSINEYSDGMEILTWISMKLFNNNKGIASSTKIPSIEAWKNAYGEHWSTYIIIANILKARELKQHDREEELAKRLAQRISELGSWYGDNLLTSLCILTLQSCDTKSNVWQAAATWLRDQIEKTQGDGIPVVCNLDIWHTSLTIELFSASDMPFDEPVATAVNWLIKERLPKGPSREAVYKWSWSSESSMPCMDSTSVFFMALKKIDSRNVAHQRVVQDLDVFFRTTLEKYDSRHYRYPTFLVDEKPLSFCPIISSRIIRTLSLSTECKRNRAGLLVKDIVGKNWKSEWFSKEAVTHGLALWYLSPYLYEDDMIRAFIDGIETRVKSKMYTTNEEIASICLGLIGCKNYFIIDGNELIDGLVATLLANECDGKWAGAPICTYGFGLRYCDNHFATILSLRALIEYVRMERTSVHTAHLRDP